MRRRDFITVLAGTAAWPLAVRAQQRQRPTIGFLGSSTSSAWSPWTAAFLQRLRELGWTEAPSIAIEYRWARGPLSAAPRSQRNSPAQGRCHRLVGELGPRGQGGNCDGSGRLRDRGRPDRERLHRQPGAAGRQRHRPVAPVTDTAAKRLELLREIVPGLRRLAILARLDNPSDVVEAGQVEAAGRAVGPMSQRQMPKEPATSRLPSTRSKGAPTPFTSSATRSSWPMACASTCWRSGLDCRRRTAIARGSRSAA